MDLTVDSWAWVELFRDSAPGRTLRHLVEDAGFCVTPDIVLAEVAAFGRRNGLQEREVLANLARIGELAFVVGVDPALAWEGARAHQELKERARAKRNSLPGLADGLILATARRFGTRLVTGNRHFADLAETLWLE